MRPNPTPGVKNLAEDVLRVRDIASPLWQVHPRRPVRHAVAELEANGFDEAVLAEEPVRRAVSLERLAGARSVVAAARPIAAEAVVAAELPLSRLLRIFESRQHVFVLDGDSITGIVTRADLNAPAVGMLALAYFTALETGISELIRVRPTPVLELLPSDERKRAESLFARKQRNDEATDIVDCLHFPDWLIVLSKTPWLLHELRVQRSCVDRYRQTWTPLRNSLAHGGTMVDLDDSSAALATFAEVRTLTERLWTVLDHELAPWDTYAATTIRRATGRSAPLAGVRSSKTWRFDAPIHVLTAWNPMSRVLPDSANQRSNRRLASELTDRGLVHDPVLASADDRSWHEDSFLVEGLDREDAVLVARQFGQAALFEINATEVLVLRCSDGQAVRTAPRRR